MNDCMNHELIRPTVRYSMPITSTPKRSSEWTGKLLGYLGIAYMVGWVLLLMWH